ncbi:MAG: alpha/beta hydrolase [Dokdonella sp.]
MSTRVAVERRLSLRHLTVAAKAWGDPSLPPLLALHGWLDNAASFDGLAPLLESHYVVAIDLVGHGRSDWRNADGWYYWLDHLDDVHQVFDCLGWQSADLLGHSLGGTLASSFAATFPDRVQRLILIEALGPLPMAQEQTVPQLRKGISARAAWQPSQLRIFPSMERAAQTRMRANELSKGAAMTLVERGLVEVDGETGNGYRWSSDPRLLLPSLQRYSEQQVLAILDSIVAPTLLLLADPAHPYATLATMQSRIERVAKIQCQRLPGNHHLHLESPAPVAAAIKQFLALAAGVA